jgi:hypothetical protein
MKPPTRGATRSLCSRCLCLCSDWIDPRSIIVIWGDRCQYQTIMSKFIGTLKLEENCTPKCIAINVIIIVRSYNRNNLVGDFFIRINSTYILQTYCNKRM